VGRLTRAVSAVLDYTWPVACTLAALIGSERLNRWLRPEENGCYEPDVVG